MERPLDEDTIAKIEAALTEDKNLARRAKYLVIFLLMTHAGLGVSEIVNLRLQDINLGEKIICVGSGKRRREVPISKRLEAAFITYLEFIPNEQVYLFENRAGEPITPRSIQSRMCRLAAQIGVNITPRELRASFYRRLCEKGVRPEIIAYLKGNSRLDTVISHLPQITREQLMSTLKIIGERD